MVVDAKRRVSGAVQGEVDVVWLVLCVSHGGDDEEEGGSGGGVEEAGIVAFGGGCGVRPEVLDWGEEAEEAEEEGEGLEEEAEVGDRGNVEGHVAVGNNTRTGCWRLL